MKKIVVFGAGSAWSDLSALLPPHIDVVALLDNATTLHGSAVEGRPVFPPDAVSSLEFDRVVLTGQAVDAMSNQLRSLGVPDEKLLIFGVGGSAVLSERVRSLHDDAVSYLELAQLPAGLVSSNVRIAGDGHLPPGDWVRYATMRLAVDEIERGEVEGAVAELGVFQGKTAAFLNEVFPTRRLHLFDTFEGFAQEDLAGGRETSLSTAQAGQFANTSVQLVVERLPHRDRALVHQGYFPDSAEGVDDRYAFVSLDVDLYQPTLAGLQYFVPRMNPGGYIFVHDYNNARFGGVRKAVDEFLREHALTAVAIPDVSGSIVLRVS